MKKKTLATTILAATTAVVPRRYSVIPLAALLCLSFGSCKSEPTPEHRNLEETSSGDDENRKEMNSLDIRTTERQIKAEEIKKKDVILHKTKAQYAIY